QNWQNADSLKGKNIGTVLGYYYFNDRAAADEKGIELEYEDAREIVYGMPYSDWKSKHQTEATPEQLAKMQEKQGH
ncbi:MAG: DUF1244 domain-containing protein, partial [Alphaproteobacteria bacterium]